MFLLQLQVNSEEYQQWDEEESSVFDQEEISEKYNAYTELYGLKLPSIVTKQY